MPDPYQEPKLHRTWWRQLGIDLTKVSPWRFFLVGTSLGALAGAWAAFIILLFYPICLACFK